MTKCNFCKNESDVGVSSGEYHYDACEKCWAKIKRGQLEPNYDDIKAPVNYNAIGETIV